MGGGRGRWRAIEGEEEKERKRGGERENEKVAVTKAEKPQDLAPASWIPREARVMIQPESQDLGSGGVNEITPSLRAGDEMRCLSSNIEAGKKGQVHLPLPFVLFKPSVDWRIPTHIGGGSLLY